MKERMISWGKTVFLIIVIFFILFIIAAKSYIGPYLKWDDDQKKMAYAMMEKIRADDLKNVEFYQLDQSVWIMEVNYQENDTLIWFDKDLNLLAQYPKVSYHPQTVVQMAEKMGLKEVRVHLGWYNEQAMIVAEDKEWEIGFSFDTLEVIFQYQKGAVL